MFTAISGAASIIGLLLTIFTLIAATSAASAARDARAEVRKSNAAEDFQHLQLLANDFLGSVEGDRIDAALIRSKDLMSAMRIASRRWKPLISDENGRKYEESALQVSVIARALATIESSVTAKDKQRLLTICHEVLSTISTVAGSVIAEIESQGDLDGNNH
jgi:hypothetical protein